ncbi:MAG: hypothetical protein C0403_05805 [Desulfobacterium sp.]|nr:hypothetical protein [Desulfobacterium sp.]
MIIIFQNNHGGLEMNEQLTIAPRRIGWFCSYVPEEIILAAGCEPVRLEGRVERFQEIDSYLHANLCFTIRNIFESGLRKQYDDLDAVIFANSCDGMRRLYELWSHYIQTPAAYFLEIPKNRDENGISFFSSQLLNLKNQLEEDFAVSITAERLVQAGLQMNERRGKMLELFERQKASPLPYKGSELHTLAIQEGRLPKRDMYPEIQSVLEKPVPVQPVGKAAPRLLVSGNEGTTPTLFRLIENSNADVVLFDTCRGLNHYTGMVSMGNDPIQSIARRYLFKPACARMPGSAQRMERLAALIDEYAIDGVVYSGVQFCDYTLFESALIEPFLKARSLPVLVVENDYIWSNTEQIRTRIEAFVEMTQNKRRTA